MGYEVIEELFKNSNIGDEFTTLELCAMFTKLTNNSISSYYSFLFECRAFGFLQRTTKGKYILLKLVYNEK